MVRVSDLDANAVVPVNPVDTSLTIIQISCLMNFTYNSTTLNRTCFHIFTEQLNSEV